MSRNEYFKHYMRNYRKVTRQVADLDKQFRSVNNLWMRVELAELIMSKLGVSKAEMHSLVDLLYKFLGEKFPKLAPEQINSVLNVHLVNYYRLDLIPKILDDLKGVKPKHPSLSFAGDKDWREVLKLEITGDRMRKAELLRQKLNDVELRLLKLELSLMDKEGTE